MTIRIQNFYPQLNYTLVATGASSTPQAIATGTGIQVGDFRIANNTNSTAYIAWAYSTATATASVGGLNSVPILAGGIETFHLNGASSIAVILGTSTASGNVFVTAGQGL